MSSARASAVSRGFRAPFQTLHPLLQEFHLQGGTLRGIRLLLRLLPWARAGKRIEAGRYVFDVEFSIPRLGRVPSYGGNLQALPEPMTGI